MAEEGWTKSNICYSVIGRFQQVEEEKKKLEDQLREVREQLAEERKEKHEIATHQQLLLSKFERLADDAVQSGDMVFKANETQIHAHSCVGMLSGRKYELLLRKKATLQYNIKMVQVV